MASVKQFHISGDFKFGKGHFFNHKPTILDQGEAEAIVRAMLNPWDDETDVLNRLSNLEVGEYLTTTHIRAIIRLKDRELCRS